MEISQLSDIQTAMFPEFVSKWTAIGLSTEPADRERAESAIAEIYELAGYDPPDKIIWCGSPMGLSNTYFAIRDIVSSPIGRITRKVLFLWTLGKATDSVLDTVTTLLQDHGLQSLRNSIKRISDMPHSNAALDTFNHWNGHTLPNSVRSSVTRNINRELLDVIRDRVRRPVAEAVDDRIGINIAPPIIRGQFDATWLACYDFYQNVCDMEVAGNKLSGHYKLAESAGWCLPRRSICLASERPFLIKRDERGRLHADDGPAIRYPDGWSIWAWHGTRVSQKIIESPWDIDIQKVLYESRPRVRRVMLTRIGAERLREEVPVIILDKDLDGRGMPRKLFRFKGIREMHYVAYTCPSTGYEYPAQPVPPETNTCAEAVAWRFRALDVRNDGRLTKRFDYQPTIEG